jgi:tetratricopeptide (TPR) repeat protein
MLRNRRFGELTQRVEAAQAAFEADPKREEQVAQTWDTFATSDPSVAPLLEAWAAATDSYAPHVALGIHHRRRGWEARGSGSISETSREKLRAMNAHFERARASLRRAAEMHPRLAIAFENLINMEKAAPGKTQDSSLLEAAARACPSCIGPPYEHLVGSTPRWGGSYEEMERYLAELAPRIAKFPRLAALRGSIAADRAITAGADDQYEAAVRSYDEALRYGEYWQYRWLRGQELYSLQRYDEALADHEYWIAHGQRIPAALLSKAYTLGKLRRFAEAAEVIDLARHLDPTDDAIVRLATYYGARR